MCYSIATRKGWLRFTGMERYENGQVKREFEYTEDYRYSTSFETFIQAEIFVKQAEEPIGFYVVMTSDRIGAGVHHDKIYYLANKFGFVVKLDGQKVYKGKQCWVTKSSPNVRAATVWPTFYEADCFIDETVNDDSYYAVLSPCYK